MTEQVVDRRVLAQQIIDIIATEGKIDAARLTPDATFERLDVQSVDIVMILMALEEKFGVYIPIDGDLSTAKDLQSFVDDLMGRILQQGRASAA